MMSVIDRFCDVSPSASLSSCCKGNCVDRAAQVKDPLRSSQNYVSRACLDDYSAPADLTSEFDIVADVIHALREPAIQGLGAVIIGMRVPIDASPAMLLSKRYERLDKGSSRSAAACF